MNTVTITIPGKPKARQAHEIMRGKNGKRWTKMPKESENFQALVSMAAREAMKGQPPITGCVTVDYEFVFPAPRTTLKRIQLEAVEQGHKLRYEKIRADFDNLCKSVNDGIKGIAIVDDALITDGSFKKRIGKTPCTVVIITKLLSV